MKYSDQTINAYMRQHVLPIIEPMLADVATKKPQNVVAYCRQWLTDYQKINQNQLESDDEFEFRQTARHKQRRKAICSTRTDLLFDSITQYKKSQETKTRLLIRMRDLFMFKGLDDIQTNSIIDNMQQLSIEADDTLINPKQVMSKLYILDKGELQTNNETTTKHYFPGDAIGQESLLYDCSIKHAIRAKKPSVLYTIQRDQFMNEVRDAAEQKINHFKGIFDKVQVLRPLDEDERCQVISICSAICTYSGQCLLKEGQPLDSIYYVVRGKLAAFAKSQNDENKMTEYGQGTHFGHQSFDEKNESISSVISLVNSKVYVIKRAALQRLFGPISRLKARQSSI